MERRATEIMAEMVAKDNVTAEHGILQDLRLILAGNPKVIYFHKKWHKTPSIGSIYPICTPSTIYLPQNILPRSIILLIHWLLSIPITMILDRS